MNWYEVRFRSDGNLDAFYAAIPRGSIESFHHFWDEPWWPGAYVIRIKTDDPAPLSTYPGVDHVVPWDVSEDERLYGEQWPYVEIFFWASSAISTSRDLGSTSKIVHCVLNARGMSERDEAKFAVRFLWDRLTVKLRWRLYLRRRWERQRCHAEATS
jgi:hypothetical protein